jgi:hypothetical protein
MSSTYYDPDKAPNAAEWLAIDEHERIRLAQNYHAAARIKTPNPKAHALYHAIVENQIAQGHGPSCRAVERLQREGLTRHDSIHAVASVVAATTYELVREPQSSASGNELQRAMNAKLEALTAASWTKGPGDG